MSASGQGAQRVPHDASHLVVRTLQRFAARCGYSLEGVHVHCHNDIPLARGLGSSAAAIVAGHYAAYVNIPQDRRGSLEELARQCSQAEGHPDNVTAALYGGLTASLFEPEPCELSSVSVSIHPDLRVLVAIPDRTVDTFRARELLPSTVSHRDAVRQAARLALLLEALRGRLDLLFLATEDLLHQRYRRSVLPESWCLLQAWRQALIPAVISGAGPTVLAFIADEKTGRRAQEIVRDTVFAGCGTVREFEIDTEGAKVVVS